MAGRGRVQPGPRGVGDMRRMNEEMRAGPAHPVSTVGRSRTLALMAAASRLLLRTAALARAPAPAQFDPVAALASGDMAEPIRPALAGLGATADEVAGLGQAGTGLAA